MKTPEPPEPPKKLNGAPPPPAIPLENIEVCLPQENQGPTAYAAALADKKGRDIKREMILEWVKSRGLLGATHDEGHCHFRWVESTVRKRMIEMSEACILVNSGRTRPTRTGHQAIIWVHRDFADENCIWPQGIICECSNCGFQALRKEFRAISGTNRLEVKRRKKEKKEREKEEK